MRIRQNVPVRTQIYYLPILAAIGFLIVSVIEFGAQSFRADLTQKNVDNLVQINKIRAVQRQMADLRVLEKEFINHPGKQPENKIMAAVVSLTNLLNSLDTTSDLYDVNDLTATAAAYHDQFADVVHETRTIGFSESNGLRGALRTDIHAVERILKQKDPSLMRDMLQMRRREKDFIIRGGAKYLDLWKQSVAVFQETAQSVDLAPKQRAMILALVGSYMENFSALAKHKPDLASDEAKLNAYSAAFQHKINISFTKTILQLQRSIDQGKFLSNRAGVFVELAIFLTGILIFLFSKWIGLGIAQPLEKLNASMKGLARGDLHVRIPATDFKNEIGTMANAVRTFRSNEKTRRVEHLKLQRLSTKTQNILNSMSEAMFEMDMDGNVTSINAAASQLVGYPQDEFIGRNISEFVMQPPETDEQDQTGNILNDILNATEQGVTFNTTIQSHLCDIPVATSASWVHDEKGKTVGSLCIMRNISTYKMAEQEIMRFKRALDQSSDEYYMYWLDSFQIFFMNEAACHLTGWSIDDLPNKNLNDFHPNFDEAGFRARLDPLVRGEVDQVKYERKEPRTGKDVEVTMELVKATDDTPAYVTSFVRDITERKAADRAKTEFISTVSHELRTPLTSIKGSLGILDSGVAGEMTPKSKSLVSLALKNSARLGKLINELLDFGKINAGKMEFNLVPVELGQLITESVSTNMGYAQGAGVNLIAGAAPLPIWVNADADRLMQIIANLISNAVKFSEKGADVRVDLTPQGEKVRISVADTGSGIPVSAQATLFDKFTQVDSSDRRAKGGTGLGLNLVMNMVKAHGSKIAFTSKVGKGTTFYFDLAIIDHETAHKGIAPPASDVDRKAARRYG